MSCIDFSYGVNVYFSSDDDVELTEIKFNGKKFKVNEVIKIIMTDPQYGVKEGELYEIIKISTSGDANFRLDSEGYVSAYPGNVELATEREAFLYYIHGPQALLEK